MEYLELKIKLEPRDPWAEVLIAELAENGFDSFVETEDGILAYGTAEGINVEESLSRTSVSGNPEVKMDYSVEVIPHQNWNALWEADFKPVEIGSRLVILAPFHDADSFSQEQKIIIQPQMSFGTGHHQTTYLMSQYLMDFASADGPMKSLTDRILDMGTGTGVLAILAEKLGSSDILAVDIEPWSVENTVENAQRNGCKHIRALTGDIDVINENNFGLILANINKNVLKNHLPHYRKLLAAGGTLLLSGFFMSDVAELAAFAADLGLECMEIRERETWAAIRLTKN